jgi:hypothetical protein
MHRSFSELDVRESQHFKLMVKQAHKEDMRKCTNPSKVSSAHLYSSEPTILTLRGESKQKAHEQSIFLVQFSKQWNEASGVGGKKCKSKGKVSDLEMAFQVIKCQAFHSHYPHHCFGCRLCKQTNQKNWCGRDKLSQISSALMCTHVPSCALMRNGTITHVWHMSRLQM